MASTRHVILDAVLLGAVVGTVERLERAAEDGRVSALDVLAALKSPVLTALRMRYSELEDDLIALMDGVVAGNRAVFEEPEAGEENAGIMSWRTVSGSATRTRPTQPRSCGSWCAR
jgi:hypothetical protein